MTSDEKKYMVAFPTYTRVSMILTERGFYEHSKDGLVFVSTTLTENEHKENVRYEKHLEFERALRKVHSQTCNMIARYRS